MKRLHPDSYIAYNKEEGMSELARAVKWLVHFTQDDGIFLHGGYCGPAYYYKDIVLVVDPGHESQKYTGIDAWKIEDVIELYRKYKDKYEDDIFDDVWDKSIDLKGV